MALSSELQAYDCNFDVLFFLQETDIYLWLIAKNTQLWVNGFA